MTRPTDDTTIGVPKDLKRRFEALSIAKSYRGFAEFCRDAIRDKIDAQEQREGRN